MTSQTERTRLRDPQTTIADRPEARTSTAFRYVMAALRLSLGWIFLWAFLDKTFGLGHGTTSAQAWISGGHPTSGFLAKAAEGPFKGFYNGIAGAWWTDTLFMLGLAGIGVALMAGIAMRFAAAAGSLLLVLMWTAVLPPASNPFMDDHLIYAMVLALLAIVGAGRFFGFGQAWERLPIVQRYPFLK
jgi:thiosulfate dehydrogenase [quinone] large subunit